MCRGEGYELIEKETLSGGSEEYSVLKNGGTESSRLNWASDLEEKVFKDENGLERKEGYRPDTGKGGASSESLKKDQCCRSFGARTL